MAAPHQRDDAVMIRSVLANILRMPEPADADDEAARNPIAREYLRTWRSLMSLSDKDGKGDREDFWEMAARLHAAVNSTSPNVYLLNDEGGYDRIVGGSEDLSRTGATVTDEHAQRLLRHSDMWTAYGPVGRYSAKRLTPARQIWLANSYSTSETFTDLAGRIVVRCGVPEDGEDVGTTLEDALTQIHEATGEDFVAVKSTSAKGLALTMVDAANPKDAAENFMLEVGAMHLWGRPGALLAQQVIPMEDEYRVFIVDGRPVTGAGCVEEHTPLDSTAEFSTLLRRRRNSDDPIRSDAELVARYREFARVAAIRFEREGRLDYVMDLAVDASTGRIVIVELNSLGNAGLYASVPSLVVDGLVGARPRPDEQVVDPKSERLYAV